MKNRAAILEKEGEEMTEKEKALLLLTGGRGLPDLLIIRHLKPAYLFNLTTTQGLKVAETLQRFIHSKYQLEMEILPAIDPFNAQEIKQACFDALDRVPDAEWIIHFTSSPKIVGIYAYEAVCERELPFLFIDTGGQQIISAEKVAKLFPVNKDEFFKVNVEEYMGAYGRTFEIPKSAAYRKRAEAWYPVARVLAHNPKDADVFLRVVKASKSTTISVNIQASELLKELSLLGALTILEQHTKEISCKLTDKDMLDFLQGDWLEVYVWKEINDAGFADDCHWGYKIVSDLPANELDVVLTYRGHLLIIECKTVSKPFETDFLYKLHSVADLVGGNYVRQVFITNYPHPTDSADIKEKFDNFSQQAEIRRISVFTGEQLKDIGSLLKTEITTPKRGI